MPWTWPLAMAFIRLPLVLVAQGFAFAYFQSQGAVQPWATAQAWTNVYFTFLVDVPCLALLAWVVHREGQTLRNVIGFERRRLPRDVAFGLGLALVLVVPFLAITFASNALLVGSQQVGLGALPPLPTWARWCSALILPISAALVEEVAYRGYALPRLANVFGNSWLALLLVSLGYGLQHIAPPLTDPQVSVARFSATFLQGGVYALLYLRLRRLIPLIVAHWAHNFVGLLGLALADSPQ